jgi:alpha-1,2-mannosyltransferase
MSASLPRPTFPPRARTILLILAFVYAAVIIASTMHRSTDLQSHLMLAQRMLDGLRVYEPRPQFGTWWPPGALVLLTPLALIARFSVAIAKGVFIVCGVACVVWIVARAPTARLAVALLALAAVSGPLQKDFENLNLNVVVLALVLATARDIASGRDNRAGIWLGLATAMKIFPALLIAYAVYRGRWRAAMIGGSLAIGLTLAPLVPRGATFTRETIGDWQSLTTTGTAGLRGHTQSLAGLIDRTGAPPVVGLVAGAALVLAAAWWLRRRRPLVAEVAMVTHVALLATPVVWAQNFVLLYLTWVVLLEQRLPRFVSLPLGVATSGIITAVSRPVRLAMYRAAVYTWAALVALVLLARVPPLGDHKVTSVD